MNFLCCQQTVEIEKTLGLSAIFRVSIMKSRLFLSVVYGSINLSIWGHYPYWLPVLFKELLSGKVISLAEREICDLSSA